MSSPRSLHVIYLQHGAQKQAESLEGLERIARFCFPALRTRVVVVDNALTQPTEAPLRPGVTLIDGDNSGREFTGMDRGLRWLAAQDVRPEDVVLLANDTWLRDPEADDFYRLDPAETLRAIDQNKLLGHVDCFAVKVGLFGLEMDHWVRSNFLLCRHDVISRLAPLYIQDSSFFGDSPATFFRPEAPLSPVYRQILLGFLQGQPNPAMWRWHSSRPFDRDNLEFFRLKTKAILCEHRLSATAQQLGFPLHDLSGRQVPSKELRAQLRLALYTSTAWRLVPRFRQRFHA